MTAQPHGDRFLAGWALKKLADEEDVVIRPMFGCPAFFLGRRMFACVYAEKLVLKLPAAQVTELVDRSVAEHFCPPGKLPMRQWCELHADAWRAPGTIELLRTALNWARSGHNQQFQTPATAG